MNRYEYLRAPFEVSIDITNKCNLRCLHCYNHSGNNICSNNELSDDEIINLVKDVVDMEPLNVCISGGEPLLKKDLVYKIITLIKSKNILISMVSNGLLLDEETVQRLEKCGLDRIQISLDGLEAAHDKLRNKQGVFKETIKCLDLLKESKISTFLGFVPTSWNINDFKDVVNIAIEKNSVCVRTQYIMPAGRGKKNQNYIIPTELQYRSFVHQINSIKQRIIKENLNLKIEWDDPIQHFLDVVMGENIYPQIHIKSNGNVTLTPYLPIYFGNIKETGLKSLVERGLLNGTSDKRFIEICSKINCVDDMTLNNLDLPENFIDEDIYISIGN